MSSTSKPTSTVDQRITVESSQESETSQPKTDVLDKFDFDSFLEHKPTAATPSPSVPTTNATEYRYPQGTDKQAAGSKRSFGESQMWHHKWMSTRASKNPSEPNEPQPLYFGNNLVGYVESFQSVTGPASKLLGKTEQAEMFHRIGLRHKEVSDLLKKASDHHMMISVDFEKEAGILRKDATRPPGYRREYSGPPPTFDGSMSKGSASSQTGDQNTPGASEAAGTCGGSTKRHKRN